METLAHQWKSSWSSIVFGVFLAVPGFMYVKVGHLLKIHGPSGMDLSSDWRFLVLLYWLADTLVLTAFLLFLQNRARGGTAAREFLRNDFPEIVLVITVWHLVLVVWEYPISARLESVGLGGLEVVVFLIFLLAFVPMCVRTLKKYRGQGFGYDSPPSSTPFQTRH